MKEITAEERKQFFVFWSTQRQAVKGRLSAETLRWFDTYTAMENIGYEFGELRPGKDGQWDLYFWLIDPEIRCDKNEALIASGLTAAKVTEEQRQQDLREEGVDPNNPSEVREFERLKNMSPEQLDTEVARLEDLLAKSEQSTKTASK